MLTNVVNRLTFYLHNSLYVIELSRHIRVRCYLESARREKQKHTCRWGTCTRGTSAAGSLFPPCFSEGLQNWNSQNSRGKKKKNRHLLADTYWRTSKWASARFRHRMALLQFLLTFERCIQVTSDKSECWKSSLNQDYCLQNITF